MDWVALGSALTGALIAIAEFYRRKRKALSERPERLPLPPRTPTIPPPAASPKPIDSLAPTPRKGTRIRR